jgi:hypothetical protein
MGMWWKGKNYQGHGAAFRAVAAKVCKYHGFDPKEF